MKLRLAVLDEVRRRILRPASESSPAELIEIRDAIVEDVAQRCHALSGGSIFPYSVVEVGIHTSTDDRRLVVERNLAGASGLPADIRRAIQRQGCTVPAALRVTVTALDARPRDRDWQVVYSNARNAVAPTGKTGPLPHLVVLAGEAQLAEFQLQPGSTRIGRGAEVRLSRQLRRNDIAFRDDSAIGRSVSRDHARIDCDREGNCFLVQENKRNQTGICRGSAQPIPVSAMGRPAALRDGDEIRLGEAILRFEVRAAAS